MPAASSLPFPVGCAACAQVLQNRGLYPRCGLGAHIFEALYGAVVGARLIHMKRASRIFLGYCVVLLCSIHPQNNVEHFLGMSNTPIVPSLTKW